MELKEKASDIIESVEAHKKNLDYNKIIFEILEGNLEKYLTQALATQLTDKSLERAVNRAAPINVLKKIVQKLSTLYSSPVIRKTENETDQELVDYYTAERQINSDWNDANKNYNAYKSFALELYEHEEKLKTRAVPAHLSLPYSDDEVDPMNMTAFTKVMPHKDGIKLWVYSDDEFLSVDSSGGAVEEDMSESEGENPYGVIPFVYESKSRYLLVPMIDTDTVRMTLLIPILLTDLNFASMFLSNPIIWTINADGSNFEVNPNTYLDLQGSDPDLKPEIGVLKPEPNIEAQLQMVKEELALWLSTKNIKPSAVGAASIESVSSGVALLIQEMDTTEDRMDQIPVFKKAEQDYWYKLAVMHNYHVKNGDIENMGLFSDPEKLRVDVIYADQAIPESMLDRIERLTKQIDAGLISKTAAVKELYPDMSEDAIEEHLKEIDDERASFVLTPAPVSIKEEEKEDGV